MSLLATAGVALAVFATLEAAAWALIRSLGHVPTREFPRIPRSLIEKFGSFDAELGHVPVPNSETFDRDISGKSYATRCSYNADRARTSRFAADEPAAVSTFGDSFCQCRGVQDDETWQRRMEDLLGRPVRNYGVGGHGLDQAFLRYQRLRAAKLGDTIVFAVSACTIERLVGVYKHYIEFGNVLGIKPRFRLAEDGSLELGRLPIERVEELTHLRKHRDFLRSWDENRAGYFRPYSARFPYLWFLARNRSDLMQAVALPLSGQRLEGTSMGHWAKAVRERNAERSRQAAYQRKNLYFRRLYGEKCDLFVALCGRIAEACGTDGRRAILLMLPDNTNIRFMKEHGHYYRHVLDRVASETGMQVADSYDAFHGIADPRTVFLKANASGHHTPEGNRQVAQWLCSRFWNGGIH